MGSRWGRTQLRVQVETTPWGPGVGGGAELGPSSVGVAGAQETPVEWIWEDGKVHPGGSSSVKVHLSP